MNTLFMRAFVLARRGKNTDFCSSVDQETVFRMPVSQVEETAGGVPSHRRRYWWLGCPFPGVAKEQGCWHFLARAPNLAWYQQEVEVEGVATQRVGDWGSRSLRTLLRSERIEEMSGVSMVVAAVTVADRRGSNSNILSAMRASSSNDLSGRYKRLSWTLRGRRWRKSSRSSALSDVVCSCWRRLRSCDGFLSPSSSPCRSCWSFCRLETDTRSVRAVLSRLKGLTSGGERIRSRTSVAASGDSAATTWANFVACFVMPLTVNWASTWANQSSGSAGQKGGILTVTEFVAVDGPGSDSSIVNFVLVGVTNCSGHDWDQREVILFRKIHKMTHNQFHAVVSRPRLAPGTSDATGYYRLV